MVEVAEIFSRELATLSGTVNGPEPRICKRFTSTGIDCKESIPPAYVSWRAGTSNRVVAPAVQAGNPFLGSLKGLQIRTQRGQLSVDKGDSLHAVNIQISLPLSALTGLGSTTIGGYPRNAKTQNPPPPLQAKSADKVETLHEYVSRKFVRNGEHVR
jgi:hypothetical protein